MDELTTGAGGDEAAADELAELRERLTERESAERAALGRLREALIASDPAIEPEMVTGETLDDIERSFAAAKATADRIRESVRREHAAAIPAGGATRSARTPQSPIEKIRAGLGGR